MLILTGRFGSSCGLSLDSTDLSCGRGYSSENCFGSMTCWTYCGR